MVTALMRIPLREIWSKVKANQDRPSLRKPTTIVDANDQRQLKNMSHFPRKTGPDAVSFAIVIRFNRLLSVTDM
jgi:hypothetical protein